MGFITNVNVRNSLLVTLCIFLGPLAWAAGVTSAPASQPAEDVFLPELSQYFPVWTQAYLEVRNLDDNMDQVRWLMNLFDRPGTSASAATLSSQPVPALAKQFDAVLRYNLKISSREFLTELLGEHFVLGWGGPLMRDQFGLICRVRNYEIIGKFLTANKAEPQPSTTTQIGGQTVDVKTYRLSRRSLSAAVIDNRYLILATTGGGEKASMFHGMADLAQGSSDQSLQQNQNFRLACTELRPDYTSLLVILTEAKGTLFSGKVGSLFDELRKNVSHIAVFSYPTDQAMNVHLDIQPRWLDTTFLPELPLTLDTVMRTMVDRRTDFVYVSSVDPYRWYRRIVDLADQGQGNARQYREMIDLALPDPGLRENLLETLGPEIMLIVSSESVATTAHPTTSIARTCPATMSISKSTTPQLALVVKTHNPTLTLDVTDQIFDIVSGFVAIHNLTTGSNGPVRNLRQEKYHGFVLNQIDLGRILSPGSTKAVPGWKLELSWTQANDYLLVGSSAAMLRRLLDRAFISPKSVASDDTIFTGLPDYAHWAVSFDPEKAAYDIDVLRKILVHLWQNIRGAGSPNGRDLPVVLGIGTKAVQSEGEGNSVVQVVAVLPGYPAWQKLQVGDVVLSVNGQAIDPASPQKDLHKKVTGLGRNVRMIQMEVLRGGRNIQVEIPLAFRNLTLTIQSMRLLNKIFQTLACNFDQIELACTYTPQGRVHVVFDFITRQKMTPASQPSAN